MMEQYIRTNDNGVKVLDYDELDTAARANFLAEVDRWAGNIEVDFSGAIFRFERVDETVNAIVGETLAHLDCKLDADHDHDQVDFIEALVSDVFNEADWFIPL